ncbi:MAG TPA: hypothetical protein VF230_10455 [Acidimicrobiales bacterium]
MNPAAKLAAFALFLAAVFGAAAGAGASFGPHAEGPDPSTTARDGDGHGRDHEESP